MREIKFRAWQPHSSLHRRPGMYEVRDLYWYNEPLVESDEVDDERIYTGEVFFKGYESSEYLEDLMLMQYTGLKDKHGKEIYEGDVVMGLGVVRWYEKDGKFMLYFNNGKNPTVELLAATYSEVIGNIYENPTLLERQS